jgi:hypothetical protein
MLMGFVGELSTTILNMRLVLMVFGIEDSLTGQLA